MKPITLNILIAIISAGLTGGISYLILVKQLKHTSAIAKIDRQANMAYTCYQCEWQRIQMIKEKASDIILLHDLQTFNIWGDDIQAVNKEVNYTIYAYLNNLNKRLIDFRLSIKNEQSDKKFYNQIIKYYQPYLNVITDIMSYYHYIDYEENRFLEEIERLCTPELKNFYHTKSKAFQSTKESIRHRVIIVQYLYLKAQDKKLHDNLLQIRDSITDYISELEKKNNLTLHKE